MTSTTPLASERLAARAPVVASAAASAATGLRAFTDLTAEHGFEPMRVTGALPAGLRGTLYRNGPALFSSFGKPYTHWFDGDGALAAVRFGDGKAAGAARVIASRGLTEERRRGRRLYGGFGTPSPRGPLTRFFTSDRSGVARFVDSKNAANTSVLWDGERLLALWEGGRPTAIDPDDLSTGGETDLGGAVVQTFSAHPHRAPGRRATYNFGMRYGRKNWLDLYERADGRAWRLAGSLEIPVATMIHDVAITERHLVVFVTPVRINLFQVLLAGGLADHLVFRPELGTQVLVAPLDDLGAVIRLEGDPRFLWHVANAYEGEGGPVVDVVLYDDFASNQFLASLPTGKPRGELFGRLSRVRLDLERRRVRFEELYEIPGEFPVVAPSVAAQPHRHVWMAGYGSREASGRDLHDRIVEVDVQTGATRSLVVGDGLYVGEPIFVPRASEGERAGWLLTLVYDARSHQSHVAVIDAERLEDGPIAAAHFGHHIPFGFHGTWVGSDERVAGGG